MMSRGNLREMADAATYSSNKSLKLTFQANKKTPAKESFLN